MRRNETYLQLRFSTSCDYPVRDEPSARHKCDEPSARHKCDEALSETQEDTLGWVEINYMVLGKFVKSDIQSGILTSYVFLWTSREGVKDHTLRTSETCCEWLSPSEVGCLTLGLATDLHVRFKSFLCLPVCYAKCDLLLVGRRFLRRGPTESLIWISVEYATLPLLWWVLCLLIDP